MTKAQAIKAYKKEAYPINCLLQEGKIDRTSNEYHRMCAALRRLRSKYGLSFTPSGTKYTPKSKQ